MAAESGNPVAQVILGFKYEHGMGVEIDYQEAARLYTLAAKPRTC
jgi:TPR repeat protein